MSMPPSRDRFLLHGLAALLTSSLLALPGAANGQSAPEPDQPDVSRPLVYRIPGDMQLSELYIGGYEMSETETIWRFMCGSDVQGRTAADLQAIDARQQQQMSQPDVLVLDSGGREDGLNLIFYIGGSVPQDAIDAIQVAETIIESKFADPVELGISISYDNLGSGVLGATSSNYKSAYYTTARSSLYDGRDADDVLQALLPYGSTIPVRYTATSDTITDESRVFFTYANYRAVVGTVSGTGASMVFNTQFTFDYDPSNGVNGTSFMDVIIHEVGHALGFTSGVDYRTTDIESLDLYRFPLLDGDNNYNPDSAADFNTTPRLQDFNAPNGQHMCDLLSIEYRMADGSPYQASHFREQSQPIGIMDPAIAAGQTLYPDYFLQSDLDMFDAIGWDYPGPLSDCPPPGVLTVSDLLQPVCIGDFATLQVVLAQGEDGNFQWRRGNTPIIDDGGHFVGATSDTLFVIGVQPEDLGDYNCLITRDCGSSNASDTISLVLGDGPVMLTQPSDVAVDLGDAAVFFVSASGIAPTYQWTKDGDDLVDDGRIVGATTSQLIILNVEAGDIGDYLCMVGDTGTCTVPSDTATLTINGVDPCPEDLSGDGYIGQADLGILLASYEIDAGGDIDGDGTTGQADLGLLLASYDQACP